MSKKIVYVWIYAINCTTTKQFPKFTVEKVGVYKIIKNFNQFRNFTVIVNIFNLGRLIIFYKLILQLSEVILKQAMFALLLMERAVRLLVIMSVSPRKRQLYNLRSKHGRRLIFIDTSGGEACGMLICYATLYYNENWEFKCLEVKVQICSYSRN
jgi:hypothetical protein